MFILEGNKIQHTGIILNAHATIASMIEAQVRLSAITIVNTAVGEPNMGRWLPSVDEWVKVNVDGAHAHIPNSACRGLIRDSSGHFLVGFIFHMNEGGSLSAELWACVHRMKLA